jgi:hypothetical protein
MPNISRRARLALIDAVDTASGGRRFNRDPLLDAAREAFASEHFAALWARTIEARLVTIERLDSIDDRTYEAAREMVNQAAAIYIDQELDAAVGADALREVAERLRIRLSSDACVGLLTALGILKIARAKPDHP